jgi:protein gp37
LSFQLQHYTIFLQFASGVFVTKSSIIEINVIEISKMNKQKPPKGIEWTRVKKWVGDEIVELPGYTWNPTGGCMHGCTWKMPDGSITECYAKTIAERFSSSAYAQGFEHHYWRPHTLKEPLKLEESAGIFVGSMADLFGHWVPDEQIRQVIRVMAEAHWHTFQTLSKYPVRLADFNPFPDNVWVGVSLPAGHLMSPSGAARALHSYLRHMTHIQANIRFISIEPLWFDAAPVLANWAKEQGKLPFEWVIIGAASNGRKVFQPKAEWTQALLDLFDSLELPVFFKGNLKWSPWRSEFPQIKPEVGKRLAVA